MMDKENFILAFQIDNDKLFNGLIDYHKIIMSTNIKGNTPLMT